MLRFAAITALLGYASALTCNEEIIEGTSGVPSETLSDCGLCIMFNNDEQITWECTPKENIGNFDWTEKREFCVTGEAIVKNYASQLRAERFPGEI